MKALVLVILVACGPVRDEQGRPVFETSAAPSEYSDTFARLALEMGVLSGYPVLSISPAGPWHMRVDDAEVTREENIEGSTLGFAGYTRQDGMEICLRTPGWYGTDSSTQVLAHEIGHAMGLSHADHGIMLPSTTRANIGHEAEGLYEALKEQGVLK